MVRNDVIYDYNDSPLYKVCKMGGITYLLNYTNNNVEYKILGRKIVPASKFD